MSLKTKFHIAAAIIQQLDETEQKFLKTVSREIQEAEDKLQKKSEPLMIQCKEKCKGICCRNIFLDAIFTEWDFVYILSLLPSMKDVISACLDNERLFYTSDCIFLKNGVGPCIFPPNSMPQVCITTFCSDERSVSKEIRQVKRAFYKLSCIKLYGKYKFLIAHMKRWISLFHFK